MIHILSEITILLMTFLKQILILTLFNLLSQEMILLIMKMENSEHQLIVKNTDYQQPPVVS